MFYRSLFIILQNLFGIDIAIMVLPCIAFLCALYVRHIVRIFHEIHITKASGELACNVETGRRFRLMG
jgi:hypothetical protein